MSGFFFQGAREIRIGDHAQFINAETVTTIHNHESQRVESERVVPIEHSSREINPEDIIFRERISSQDLELRIKRISSTSGAGSSPMPMVKFRKEVYIAEIIQFAGRLFTVYTFEPEDLEDHEASRTVWRRVYDASSPKYGPPS
ncbi:hypothetical protein V5O48_004558 [Marasmius crinis-equi]|uniref:Uncharacterized protein n=1 Tax=Marasmius crinis-equi TaxID=585013 RepID=A0ABR3FPV9_9AGAR